MSDRIRDQSRQIVLQDEAVRRLTAQVTKAKAALARSQITIDLSTAEDNAPSFADELRKDLQLAESTIARQLSEMDVYKRQCSLLEKQLKDIKTQASTDLRSFKSAFADKETEVKRIQAELEKTRHALLNKVATMHYHSNGLTLVCRQRPTRSRSASSS